MTTKWVKVTELEWVTVVGGIKASIFNAPYLSGHAHWELFINEDQPAGYEASQVAAMYRMNRGLEELAGAEQSRKDRLEACSYALTVLVEAWRIGNLTSDEYAKHTARVYGEIMEFLAEKDENNG